MDEKKYSLIEYNDSFIVCHGSGLSWAEAHLLLISLVMDDCGDNPLRNVKLFELEANEPGLGMTFEYGENLKTAYYILDDPGNIVAK